MRTITPENLSAEMKRLDATNHVVVVENCGAGVMLRWRVELFHFGAHVVASGATPETALAAALDEMADFTRDRCKED